jgi:drug/metabolite transporter (DMT)-like permease
MTHDRTTTGIFLMVAFCVLAPLLDASAKAATATIPVGQITAARFVGQALCMLPLAWALRLSLRAAPGDLALIAARAALLMGSTYCFVAGVQVMPIADALAIVFVMPFILMMMGKLFFGNPVGPRRIGASIVGFGGALLVIQPSLAHYGPAALFPLGTALLFAFYEMVTQAMAGRVHPVTMQLHTSLAGSLLAVPMLWAANGSGVAELDPVWPEGIAWFWLAGVGFWAAVSHLCMTYALKFAPAVTLAPLHYLEIPMAVLLGYTLFGDFPNPMTWAGILVIVGSGLYIVRREQIIAGRARSARQAAPPAAG